MSTAIDRKAFLNGLRFVLRGVAKDHARPILTAVLFESDGLTSADNYRIHHANLPLGIEPPLPVYQDDAKALVRELSKSKAATVSVDVTDSGCRVTADGVDVVLRAMQGPFPNYRAVLPHLDGPAGTIDARLLLNALPKGGHVSLLPGGSAKQPVGISLVFKDGSPIGEVPDAGLWPAPITLEGRYLIDALKGAGSVFVRIIGSLSPIRLDRDDDTWAVVMPVRTPDPIPVRAAKPPRRLFKFLNEDGSCCHSGKGSWPLPKDGKPGEWIAVDGPVVPCQNGLHLVDADHLSNWVGPALYVAEARGELLNAGDKWVAREARLVRRVTRYNRAFLTRLALANAHKRIANEDIEQLAREARYDDGDLAGALRLTRKRAAA